MVRLLRAHEPETAGHCRRVRWYALQLADSIGLTPRQRRHLALAAQLHDLGKLCVPLAVLQKPGPLTEEEYRLVQEHAVAGERLLAPFHAPAPVLAAIRGHHERFDGAGYPDGLKGERIPLLARIIAVADTFDALTSTRAYREPESKSGALRRLRDAVGTQLDPTLVMAFRCVLEPANLLSPCSRAASDPFSRPAMRTAV
jgi:HD-GYP domain-containing protein (c-di-GMP phosphodiesterase class II)